MGSAKNNSHLFVVKKNIQNPLGQRIAKRIGFVIPSLSSCFFWLLLPAPQSCCPLHSFWNFFTFQIDHFGSLKRAQ